MSEPLIEVREARTDEASAVGALTVAGYDANDYLVLPDGTRDVNYAAWLNDALTRIRDSVVLVAVSSDEPEKHLGTVTWCPPGSPLRELATQDDQGEFRTLSVDASARRRGVGAALVDWCLAEARATGLREVLLSSVPVMTDAHRLYRSRGFQRRPELDWEPIPDVVLWAFSLTL